MRCAAALSLLGLFGPGIGLADDPQDSIILLAPPARGSPEAALLVWVPGGLVPNIFYRPLMEKVQKQLSGAVDLWVSIASCPNRLCIPGLGEPNITEALQVGRAASGLSKAGEAWLGGHSLGGAATDAFCVRDNATEIGGGCLILGDFIFGGPSGMLDYPVPVLTLLGELDYGSARNLKMAPYFVAADGAGLAQLERTPVVVLQDVDHSDMCEGFHVPGDLPSALPVSKATHALAEAAGSFMKAQIGKDAKDVARVRELVDTTRPYMTALQKALELDLRSAGWCAEMQLKLLGEALAKKVSVTANYSATKAGWSAPSAELTAAGLVSITVTGHNEYEEDGGLWPPGSVPAKALRASVGVPAPMRDTATTQGCRLVSAAKVAKLLGESVPEPENFCEEGNQAAWQWVLDNAPQHALERYKSLLPCRGCAPAVPIRFQPDTDAGANFSTAELGYTLDAQALVVQSPSFVSSDEHSCMFLSPARALDFLLLDAYTASIYPEDSFHEATLLV